MKTLKRIFSTLLAISFLMATTGFSVYEHYCGDNLVDKSLYSSNTTCNPDHKEEDCSSTAEKDCCTDQFEYLQLDVELKNPEWNRKLIDLGYLSFAKIPTFTFRIEQAIPETLDPNFSEIPIINSSEPIFILQQKLVYYG